MKKDRSRVWPVPGDSPTDRARAIARAYRRALAEVDPELCARLDDAAAEVGQDWVRPQTATHDLDAWVSAERAAELVGLTPRAVRAWITRTPTRLPRARRTASGAWEIRVGDLLDAERAARRDRARGQAS